MSTFFCLCLSLFVSCFLPGNGDRTWAGRWVLSWNAREVYIVNLLSTPYSVMLNRELKISLVGGFQPQKLANATNPAFLFIWESSLVNTYQHTTRTGG